MGAAATRIGKKAVRIINGTVNLALVCAVLLLAAFGGYALWDSRQVYSAADAARYEIYKPLIEDGGRSFGELQAINPEVFSWLTVYGTNIDYPVTQGENNMKYINTNAEGSYSLAGSIFLDCENSKEFSDFNSILYGHHMEKQAMFGEIGLFADKEYFDARLYGNLYYNGRDHGLEFFAYLHTDAYDFSVFAPDIEGAELRRIYLDNLLSKADHTRDMGVTANDRIVLLSTCSPNDTNGRDILIGRITDDVYADAFAKAEPDNAGPHATADRQRPSTWTGMPLWLWMLLLALAVLVLLVIVRHITRRKHRHPKEEKKDIKQKER